MAGVHGNTEVVLSGSSMVVPPPVGSGQKEDMGGLDLGLVNTTEQRGREERGCVAGESSPMPTVNFTSSSSPGQHKARQVLGLRGRALGGVCELYAREGSKRVSELGRGV